MFLKESPVAKVGDGCRNSKPLNVQKMPATSKKSRTEKTIATGDLNNHVANRDAFFDCDFDNPLLSRLTDKQISTSIIRG
jgi:hypothetical protein